MLIFWNFSQMPIIRIYLLLNFLTISFVFLFTPIILAAERSQITLRSSYLDLSLAQVLSLPGVSIRKSDKWGFYGHSTIKHSFEKKYIEGNEVVIDHATGLMWHQSGSINYMRWNSAKEWIRILNNKGYAGFQDWRLPTLDEAVSLLEPGRWNNLYIDSVFSDEQWGIWTGDKHGSLGVWSVYFSLGNVRWRVKNRYVRKIF
jgi:serine/threonine-protein kinase